MYRLPRFRTVLEKIVPREFGLPILLLLVLYIATITFRPLLPVDETRYMSIAWEMYLRHDPLAPLTMNFQPYNQKPPLLFWNICLAWWIFGISRWAGAIPFLLVTLICVFLTKKLAEELFPGNEKMHRIVPMIMVGSIPVVIYGLLVMFDITLTVFVLISLISLLRFARSGKTRHVWWLSLAMALGVLTKGPVAWLFILYPMLFGPLWMSQKMNPVKWYLTCLAALILSVVPVLLWLVPVILDSTNEFTNTLIWEQSVGRITGGFRGSHSRPIWFYLPLLPGFLIPWLFFPSFWQQLKQFKTSYVQKWSIRFLTLWIVPVFISFSLIHGKQPHYLVPLIPGMVLFVALLLKKLRKKIIFTTVGIVLVVFIGQVIASKTVFKQLDLIPLVEFLQPYEKQDWVFVPDYQAQLTFLGRLHKSIETRQLDDIDEWMESHPNGLAIIRYKHPGEVSRYEMLFDMKYRGRRRLGVFRRR